jgi:hypothetical protein
MEPDRQLHRPCVHSCAQGSGISTSDGVPPTTVKVRCTGAASESGRPFQRSVRCCAPGGATGG